MSTSSTAATELKQSIFSSFTRDAECLLPGRPDEAIILLETVVSLFEATGSAGDPCLEKPLADLARLYLDAGDFARAELRVFSLIRLVSSIRGPVDAQLANYFDLAVRINIKQGVSGLPYALEAAKRSLGIKELNYGPVSRRAADSYYTLGVLYAELMQPDEALRALGTAFDIYRGTLGVQRPETARTAARMALIGWSSNASRDEEQRFKDQLLFLESMVGTKDPQVLELLEAEAATLRKLGRKGEAVAVEARIDKLAASDAR